MQDFNDYEFGLYEGECQGCELFTRVNDIGLCEECDAKFDRDMIRLREWDYSASAFAVPKDKREAFRNEVIKKYGKKLELVVKEQAKKGSGKKRKK